MGQILIPKRSTLHSGRLHCPGGGVQDLASNLASAYGIAVTGTMIITTLLFHAVVVVSGIGVVEGRRADAASGTVDLAFFPPTW